MAENVERRMEKNVSQYEMLRSYGIMNEDEIKEIIKKREHHTSLIERSKREIKHYIEYIQYESKLLRIIVERQNNKLPISLETSLKKGMKTLYVQATNRFPDNIRLFDEYLSFTMRSKYSNADIMEIYEQILKFHAHDPEQWYRAIKWQRKVLEEEENCFNYKPCLDFIVRALRKHPADAYLKCELIDFELSNYGRQPTSVIEDRCIKIYTDDKFILQVDKLAALLELLSNYPETEKFQRLIMDDLKEKFSNEELYWQVLAQRELKGQITYKKENVPDNLPISQKTRMEVFVKVYEKACELINTKTIWSQYLDDLLEIVVDEQQNLIRFKRKLIGQAYKMAHDASKLEERHYIQYHKILTGCKAENDIIENVLIRAVNMYPNSIDLWDFKMTFYMRIENIQKVSETFAEAKKRLCAKGYPLWSYYIGFLQLTNETTLLRKAFDAVLKENSPFFNDLKAQYVQHTSLMYGVKAARQIFKNSLKSKSMILSVEMFNQMLEIEENEPIQNIEEWRGILEHATNAFGKTEISLWEKYVDFEMKYGDPIRSSEIITRAEKTLDEKMATQFRLNRLLATTIKIQMN